MLRLLLVVAVIAAYFYFRRVAARLPPAQRRRLMFRAIVIGAIAGLTALAVTGRMHWAAPLLAALIPLLRGVVVLAMPLLVRLLGERVRPRPDPHGPASGDKGRQQPPPGPRGMQRSEALATLGLSDPVSRDDIIQAHRRLIQRVHPDRGGSDYLAARINLAKDVLLG
ncbi:MAG: hypothetical protein RBS88_00375 [Spongiibacteraceae bacterium]|jgi:hypothetical protein|nr:hypothetical protein [Spongiibacteraceae bacterium]